MTIANWSKLDGGGKALDEEIHFFQFSGTTLDAILPTSLQIVAHATFMTSATGTGGFTANESIYISSGIANGTSGVGGSAAYTGGIYVSGTSVTVNRGVTNLVNSTVQGTANSGLWVSACLRGVS